jgi:hypothetical protein
MAKATPRKKCLDAIQLLARISAADDNGFANCVSCGSSHHYKDMDGGHYIAKGHSSFWALEIENVHPQCKSCNGFGMKFGSASQNYTMWMIDYYGKDFVDNMLATTKNLKKLYKSDYDDMLKDFKAQIKEHEARIS